MATKLQVRRGTAAQWTDANPILSEGELGFETDTGKFKVGIGGSTQWSSLNYFIDVDGISSLISGAALNTTDDLSEIKEILDIDLYNKPDGSTLQLRRFIETLKKHRESLERQMNDLLDQLNELSAHELQCKNLLLKKNIK